MKSDQESKNLSRERFGQFAEGYVTSQSHARGYDLDRLVGIAAPQADWLVLDIATGGGHTALQFAPYVKKVIATDITSQMLKAARNLIRERGETNIEYGSADAEDLPFGDCAFELVTCRIAPHHFPDCLRFIQEGSRVLKLEGMLLVQDHLLPEDETAARYIDDFERLRDPSHNRAFNQSMWETMFERAGLNVAYTEEITKRHQLIPWAERQGCSSYVIMNLMQMLENAETQVAAWLQMEDLGTKDASFVNHHILIAGQKNQVLC